jgi:hypothetical protein
MMAVNPSCAYRTTFFQTFSTDPHVVSTSVHPWLTSRAMSPTVTPNAGRMTTSSDPRVSHRSPASLRKRISAARSWSLTCGLWMISPVRNTLRPGKRRRAWYA